jgi:uncharacterized protein YprB with RNaseH-like and TPR domain
MLPSDLRRKLSQLNLQREGETPVEPKSGALPGHGSGGTSPSPSALEDILPGRVHARTSGNLYIIDRDVEVIYPSGAEKIASAVERLRTLGVGPEEALFLDIETCGLANCPLFLIGTMSVRTDGIRLEQLFARDYAEEAAVLEHLAEMSSAYKMLITFNGKTFDVPYMRDRMVLHRIKHKFTQEHLDLLQHARRLFRGMFRDCKLQTLEQHFCCRRRVGDIPGWAIPDAYHQFVAGGDARQVRDIIHHNMLDLLTMAELVCAVLTGSEPVM